MSKAAKKKHIGRRYRNILGNKYGDYKVVDGPERVNGQTVWKIQCKCGSKRTITLSNLSKIPEKCSRCKQRETPPRKPKVITRAERFWRSHKSDMVKAWSSSYEKFLNAIGGELKEGKYVSRPYSERPFGPSNFIVSPHQESVNWYWVDGQWKCIAMIREEHGVTSERARKIMNGKLGLCEICAGEKETDRRELKLCRGCQAKKHSYEQPTKKQPEKR